MLKNNTRFIKEVLDTAAGEKVIAGMADGEVMIVPEFNSGVPPKKQKKFNMTLFPTNYRIVVYEAKDWFLSKDRFDQLPYTQLQSINFECFVDEDKKGKNRKVVCIVDFIVPDESIYPTISFKMDIDDMMTFDSFRALVAAISKHASEVNGKAISIKDYTDYKELKKSKLLIENADVAKK